jgi:hypothetical protein
MDVVMLISGRPFDLDALGEACPHGTSHRDTSHKRAIVVELEEGWFYVSCHSSHRDQYEDEELAHFRSQLGGELFFAGLGYSNDRVVDIAINLLPLAPDLLADTEDDLVLPISEVRRRIQAGKNWSRI